MISVTVVAVGRAKTPGLAPAIEEYENRLRHYVRFESIEVRTPARMLGRVPEDSRLIALTREGKRWSTRDLAAQLEDVQTYGGMGLAFVIGGADGLGPDILERAHSRLSLSNMTLPHELARLVLTEQLYRAGTLLRGEPYHRGP